MARTATVTRTHSQPTEAQVRYATSLATRKGYRYLSQAEKDCFGKSKIGGMNRSMMSQLIDWLAA